MKKLIVVRHCMATGQEHDAPLTKIGEHQAKDLANFLITARLPIDNIISSPFTRAIQSITPYASHIQLPIQEDERLTERILSGAPMSNWLQMLEQTFTETDVAFPGGESTRQATERVQSLIHSILQDDTQKVTLLVTHGNLFTLILRIFDESIGFSTWKSLSNPDVYEITIEQDAATIHRLWGIHCEMDSRNC
ncbi:histidine phosphatase family protein [Bacillus sp. BP-3]|uniref:histidine phosphatase family protein n=1 Tax=Bacillus sp. BP-3 TaxID=3022773 RepID=UPI00232CDC9F|nr:histidine phosphatase family protein [Bacillus sp. BP-3]MDC2865647.1 phosphoglycerate mutase family protein [Bacillus sp. BP-3]